MVDETIEVVCILMCNDCESEIKRTVKTYDLINFKLMSRFHPNNYYIESGTNQPFIISKTICETCQT